MQPIILTILIGCCVLAGVQAKSRVKRATHYDVYRALDTRNEREALRLIQDGVKVNFKDDNGQIAMHYAAAVGSLAVVKLLIEKGYRNQVNVKDKWGDTPVHKAAASSSRANINVLDVLLQNGGEIDQKNNIGKTPLLCAVEKNFVDVAEFLIKKGADINAKDNDEWTSLYYASDGNEAMVEMLLRHGANAEIGTDSGVLPRDRAAENGYKKIVDLIDNFSNKSKLPNGISKYIQNVCEVYSVQRPTDFILGGRPAKPEEFPWMVALGYLNLKTNGIDYRCAGTIISDFFILTAAHCTDTDKPPIVVRLGTLYLSNNRDSVNYYIQDIISHENYSKQTKKNDIALLRLTNKISFSPNIRPACLETDTSDQDANKLLQISGWGTTKAGTYMVSDKLMTAEVKTVSVEECSSIYKKHNEKIKHPAFQNGIDDSQYCAHGDRLTDKTRSDSCRGDSGGPLQLIRNKYAAHIVGIVSFGLGCGNEFPGIYTRVAHYTQWIASHVWPNAL